MIKCEAKKIIIQANLIEALKSKEFQSQYGMRNK